MREVLPDIVRWQDNGERVALATVVKAVGSSPRSSGAKMAVSESGAMTGSVSGGCVEADVALHALEVLESGEPRLIQYGITDEQAFEVGLACGGTIDVFIEALAPKGGNGRVRRTQDRTDSQIKSYFETIQHCIEEEMPLATATVIGGAAWVGVRLLVFDDGSAEGSLGGAVLDRQARADALEALQRGAPRRTSYPGADGQPLEVFIDVYPSPATLLIFGGVHIGIPLARFAKQLGFRVRVIDARGRFANQERFPEADEIIISYADEYLASVRVDSSTYVVVLSHDPKLDDPALVHVLRTPARYIGAIGSRSTNEKRRARLREQGLSDELIARIHAPIGLDIGSDTPEEIALAIMAEMIAAKNGRDARPLPLAEASAAAG